MKYPFLRGAAMYFLPGWLAFLAGCAQMAPPVPPAPLPPALEWWRVGVDETGKQLPVLTEPWFDSLGGPGIYDRSTLLLWSQPNPKTVTGPVTLAAAQQYCKGLPVGYRLPTRHDMDSIQDVRRLAPAIDTSVFGGAVSGFYWTSTSARKGSTNRWAVDLSDGKTVEFNSGQTANFFCVFDMRGDPPPVHYADQGATIKDNATGLVWQKDTFTAQDQHTLANACADSTVGGKRWRVPSWKELSTLLSAEHEFPFIHPLFIGETALASSTPSVRRGMEFRIVDFQNGKSGDAQLISTRCVEQALPQSAAPGRVFKGDVWISGPDILLGSRAFQQFEAGMYATIEGNLYIGGLTSASIILPYLKKVTGNVEIIKTGAQFISMPVLENVGGQLAILENTKLDSMWFPSLAAVEGSVLIQDNSKLGAAQPDNDTETVVAVSMNALNRIGGNFRVERNAQLKSLTLGRVQSVGRAVSVSSNRAMWQMALGSLRSIGLTCRGDYDFCGNISIELNSRLVTVWLPSVRTIEYNLRIAGNPLLETVQLKMDTVQNFVVEYNSSLCEINVLDPMLKNMWRYGRFPTRVEISNNSTAVGCRTRCPTNEAPGVCQILGDKQ